MDSCTNFGRFVGVLSAGINDPVVAEFKFQAEALLGMWINQKATGPV
jgi:hypothetical protein